MVNIGLSTGMFHKFYGDEEINRRISHIARWNVDVVEILFSRLFMLNIPINPENKEFLKKKKVTIHAPFFVNEGYTFCMLGHDEIKKLVSIGKDLNAEYIVIHPNQVTDLSILSDYDFKFVFENIKPKLTDTYFLENMKGILDKFPSVGFALDPGHSKHLSMNEIIVLTKKIKDLREVHCRIYDSKDFIANGDKTHSYLKTLNANVLIEGVEDFTHVHEVIKKMREIVR